MAEGSRPVRDGSRRHRPHGHGRTPGRTPPRRTGEVLGEAPPLPATRSLNDASSQGLRRAARGRQRRQVARAPLRSTAGRRARQAGSTNGQRARRSDSLRAAGSYRARGPSIEGRRSRFLVEPRDPSPAGPRCRDVRAGRTGRAPGARSTIWPAYITATSSAISATTPRSCVIRMMAVPVSRRQPAPSGRGSAPGW